MDTPDAPKEGATPPVPRTEYRASATPATGFLAPDALVERCVYRLRSRNLDFGVYNGARGFIGIRTKFDYRYLDTEGLADPPGLGRTAHAIELVGRIDDPIALTETLGTDANGWISNTALLKALEAIEAAQ